MRKRLGGVNMTIMLVVNNYGFRSGSMVVKILVKP